MRVGIIGIGGLGHLAIQFAHAFGCEVTAFSSTKDKEEEAKRLGAHNFVSIKDASVNKYKNYFDLALPFKLSEFFKIKKFYSLKLNL